MRVLCCFLLVACSSAAKTSAPVAGGPHGENEKLHAHGGTLSLTTWPDTGVVVRGEQVIVTVFAEGDCDTTEALRAQTKRDAEGLLASFVDTATQQLDLQLQAAGQAPASNDEAQAIRAKAVERMQLGDGEHAWQTFTRDDQKLTRVFARYTLKLSTFAAFVEAGLGERPKKADIARKVFAAFDPDVK